MHGFCNWTQGFERFFQLPLFLMCWTIANWLLGELLMQASGKMTKAQQKAANDVMKITIVNDQRGN